MRKLKNETAFQKLIRKSLSYNFLSNCHTKKNHGSQYTERGVADIDGHVGGYYVAIEAKMWNNRPSGDQIGFLRKVNNSGGLGLYLIYQYTNDEHVFHWVPGDMPFSYRMKAVWPKSGLIYTPRDPKDPEGEKIQVIDCSPLTGLIKAKRMTCKTIF